MTYEMLPPSNKQIVCFIDLLGFKERVLSSKNPNLEVSLLKEIKSFSNLKESFIKNSENGFHICPAVTCFSDSVVISIPIPEEPKTTHDDVQAQMEEVRNKNFCFQAVASIAKNIGHIALLEHGLLIRGGISIGNLYHEDHVIVGDALIKAYEAECKKAIYPRLVIDSNLSDCLNLNEGFYPHLTRDNNGDFYIPMYDSSWLNIEASAKNDGETKNWSAASQLNLKIIQAFDDGIGRLKESDNRLTEVKLSANKISAEEKWEWAKLKYKKTLAPFQHLLK